MDAIYLLQLEAKRRGLSENTSKAYSEYVARFLKFVKKEPEKLTKRNVREYLEYLSISGKSSSTKNMAFSAIKFLIHEVLNRTWNLNMKFSRRPKSLPTVLTKKEIFKLISACRDPEHRLLISLMYGAGLRISETIRLKKADLENGYGWVRRGKGNKDRLFIIPDLLKLSLIEKPEGFIFMGNKGNHISRSSAYQLVKKYAACAGIKKNIHPHTLRHSFATHLVEEGNDLLKIQVLMGHNSLETTKGYIHMAFPKIVLKSPLDSIDKHL